MSYHDPSRARPHSALDSNEISLEVRQQPQQALVTNEHKEKTRKAVDPPPIVQLKIHNEPGGGQGTWMVNPFLFMTVTLVKAEQVSGHYEPLAGTNLLGTTVSSLNRLKDLNNKDGGFFVFADISCRSLGMYRLLFTLFDYAKPEQSVVYVASEYSDPFPVVTSKDFRGQMESTPLSRTFSDQGVRLRLRKEQRTLSGSKRSFSQTSPSSSTPVSYNVQGGQRHDRAYGYSAPKRQRSDSDYTAQIYQTPAPQTYQSTMFSYGAQPLPPQSHQSLPSTYPEPFAGFLGQGGSHPTSSQDWQRYGQQLSLSATGGGIGSYTYLGHGSSTPTAQRQYAIPRPPRHHARQHSSRTSDDPSTAISGLHLPASIPTTLTPQPQQYYSSQASTDTGQMPPPYQFQYQHNTPDTQSQYGLRYTQMANPYVQSYDPAPRTATSSAAHDERHEARSIAPYEQGTYAGAQESYEREPISPNPEHLSDPNLPLDTGILNREFIPPFPDQPAESVEQELPEYKPPPQVRRGRDSSQID